MQGLERAKVGKRSSATLLYTGRPSKWGNPFVIGRDGSRADVIAKYRAWIVTQPERMKALDEQSFVEGASAMRTRLYELPSPSPADSESGKPGLDLR